MACYVPDEHKSRPWHIIKPHYGDGYELAQWVNDERNGPQEKGHWIRWGYCGDFPSLCAADYIGPLSERCEMAMAMVDTTAKVEESTAS